jgi:hypothetical protein
MGYGAICLAPCLSSDGEAVLHTTSAYTGVGDDIIDATVGVTAAALPNPYTSAQLTNSTDYGSPVIAGRIVSASLRIQNLCKLVDESGVISMLSAPNRENLATYNVAALGAFRETVVQPYRKGKLYELTTSAISRNECEYPNEYSKAGNANQETVIRTFPFSNGQCIDAVSVAEGGAPMKMLFSGVAGSSFLWEVVIHAEFVGALASQAETPNESDPAGFELVQSAASRLPEMLVRSPNSTLRSLMGQALQILWRHRQPVANAASWFFGGRRVPGQRRLDL